MGKNLWTLVGTIVVGALIAMMLLALNSLFAKKVNEHRDIKKAETKNNVDTFFVEHVEPPNNIGIGYTFPQPESKLKIIY